MYIYMCIYIIYILYVLYIIICDGSICLLFRHFRCSFAQARTDQTWMAHRAKICNCKGPIERFHRGQLVDDRWTLAPKAVKAQLQKLLAWIPSCAMAFGRYKAECIGCATTQCSACYFFCNYKMKNITLSGSENNSKSALQNPMHLKLKNSWKSELLTWFFPMTFCSWVYAIQSSDQHNFGEHFVVVNDWI